MSFVSPQETAIHNLTPNTIVASFLHLAGPERYGQLNVRFGMPEYMLDKMQDIIQTCISYMCQIEWQNTCQIQNRSIYQVECQNLCQIDCGEQRKIAIITTI